MTFHVLLSYVCIFIVLFLREIPGSYGRELEFKGCDAVSWVDIYQNSFQDLYIYIYIYIIENQDMSSSTRHLITDWKT